MQYYYIAGVGMDITNTWIYHGEQLVNGLDDYSGISESYLNDYLDNQIIIGALNEEAIYQYIEGLDNNDAEAIYYLARCCIDSGFSNEYIRQIVANQTLKTKLGELANKYILGLIEPDTDQEAHLVIRQLECYKIPEVLCALGKAHNYGWGAEQDTPLAILYYRRAAEAGSYEAMERMRDCKDEEADEHLKAAFEHFKQESDVGNRNAQFAVAYSYCYGFGAGLNNDAAVKMLVEASNYGCTNAITFLGELHSSGNGRNQDDIVATRLYEYAAIYKNSEAYHYLAYCYALGKGCDQDYEQAMDLFEKAARYGHSGAACYLGFLYEQDGLAQENQIKAFYHYNQAAVAGNAMGYYSLGNCYYTGKGAPQNYRKAAYWFEKAAIYGDEDAAILLNECRAKMLRCMIQVQDALDFNFLCEASGKSFDELVDYIYSGFRFETAFCLAKLAANDHCDKATRILGDWYYYGLGVSTDFRAAALNYERLKPTDLATLAKLASCYATGYTDANELDKIAVLRRINTALTADIDLVVAKMR